VTHLHLANANDEDVHAGTLTSVLEDSIQLRAAGTGRLSRGATARSCAPRRRVTGREAPSGSPMTPDAKPAPSDGSAEDHDAG